MKAFCLFSLLAPFTIAARASPSHKAAGDIPSMNRFSAAREEILSLVDPKSGFLRITGPYFGQNLYTGEKQFQVEVCPVLPDVRRNCTESLVEGGRITIKVAAQNSEGLPLLGYRIKRVFDDPKVEFEGEACEPWDSTPSSNRNKRFVSVSIFENAIPFVIRNSTEYVYKVGLGNEGAKLIETDKRKGEGKNKAKRQKKKTKLERKRIEALHCNATQMLRELEASKRRGVDFTFNNFMRKNGGRGLKGLDYNFQTSLESITHDMLEGENVLCSTFNANWSNNKERESILGQHRISTKFSSGVRCPSLELGDWREWRGRRIGRAKGAEKMKRGGAGKRLESKKHLIYEKPRFSRVEVTTVSRVPLLNKEKERPLIQLAVKNIITSGFNSSLPLHMRDMNGFKLGRGIRGWKPNDHGPFTEGLRSTTEFRFGGDKMGRGLCCLLFGDIMCFSRAEALQGSGKARQTEGNIKFAERMRSLQQSFNSRAVTKTAAGIGVRFSIKGVRVKADLANLNSGQIKLHLGIGRDFTTEFDEECDWNGI